MPYIPILNIAVPSRVYTDQTRGTYLDDSMPHTEHVKDGNYLFENTMLAPLEGLRTCEVDGILRHNPGFVWIASSSLRCDCMVGMRSRVFLVAISLE